MPSPSIGEISLMKDLTKTMEIMKEDEDSSDEGAAEDSDPRSEDRPSSSSSSPPPKPTASADDDHLAAKMKEANLYSTPESSSSTPPPRSNTSTPRPSGVPNRLMLSDKSDADHRLESEASSISDSSKKGKGKGKAGMSQEKKDELSAWEAERRKIRQDRVDTLAAKLIDRISVWTETDKGPDTTHAFNEKTKYEVEILKMESFGIEMLHAIGNTYSQKASAFLKSQKFLGITGFFSRLRDKGAMVKETWGTISTAIDAQMTMEEMAKMEEKGGDDWTEEKKMEYERRVTGKILAAAWRGSKFEIQSVLRDVCDKVLNDKKIPLEKRVERAHALIMVGTIFKAVSPENPFYPLPLYRSLTLTPGGT